jgi:hypothetical protein
MPMNTDDTDADRIRLELARLGLGQRAAARALRIDERTLRRYCSGQLPVPRVIWLALKGLQTEIPPG